MFRPLKNCRKTFVCRKITASYRQTIEQYGISAIIVSKKDNCLYVNGYSRCQWHRKKIKNIFILLKTRIKLIFRYFAICLLIFIHVIENRFELIRKFIYIIVKIQNSYIFFFTKYRYDWNIYKKKKHQGLLSITRMRINSKMCHCSSLSLVDNFVNEKNIFLFTIYLL